MQIKVLFTQDIRLLKFIPESRHNWFELKHKHVDMKTNVNDTYWLETNIILWQWYVHSVLSQRNRDMKNDQIKNFYHCMNHKTIFDSAQSMYAVLGKLY